MKKVLFSLLAVCATCTVFAQRVVPGTNRILSTATARILSVPAPKGSNSLSLGKTTAMFDSLDLYNNYDSLLFQSSALYGYGVKTPNDSGFVFGMNAFGDNEFAEYFAPGYNTASMGDTSITIIGVYSAWGGKVNPNSTHSVTFNLWSVDTAINADPDGYTNIYLTGTPGSILGSSQSVPLTALNLNAGAATLTYFTNPIANLYKDFFLGYSISYTFTADNNDTVGLRSTPNGTGSGTGFYEADGQGDTAYFSQNAVRTNQGTWLDGYIDLNLNVNLSLLPIYDINTATNVNGVTKSNLTVFSCAPNPAINNTNIRYSLQQNADVTIQVLDAAGRTMTTIQQPAQTTGPHVVNVATANWPTGNYVYLARTSTGAAIASQLTVIK